MVVDISLKRAGDSVTGQSNVDPKGYLTDLGHIKISTDAEIGDIKRARTLLKSVVTTNPHNAPGWVAAARLVSFRRTEQWDPLRCHCRHTLYKQLTFIKVLEQSSLCVPGESSVSVDLNRKLAMKDCVFFIVLQQDVHICMVLALA